MSGEEAEAMSGSRVPKWESELWSYISKGDGVICPLYGDDKARHCNEWCFNENTEMFSSLFGTHAIVSNSGENRLDVITKLFKQNSPRKWVPGRLFQLVEALANKYVKKAKLNQPPVVTELVRQLDISPGIEIRFIPLKAHHGAVWHIEDGWVIHINSADNLIRQRHTLFHEVFHVLAHCNATPVFRNSRVTNGLFNEMLADYFASCILMPPRWIRGKWAEVNNLKQMAEIFQVSHVNMCIRLNVMNLI